ncbi:MAG: hypothetical protein FJ319_11725 [SAR202 cluster bacterium]|nr:hypothetical protein [SAR202 cluster bacterium]
MQIEKAQLVLSGDTKEKVYDGRAYNSFTASLSGFVRGDGPSVMKGSPEFGGPAVIAVDAGEHSIEVGAGTLAADNYRVTGVRPGSLRVEKAKLTVTVQSTRKVYDGAAYDDFTVIVTGFVDGDDASVVTGAAGFKGSAVVAIDAGSYSIVPTLGTLAAENYEFAYFAKGTLTIAKAPLTLDTDDKSRSYGRSNPKLTATLKGFVNGESMSTAEVAGRASCATVADATSDAGAYEIKCSKASLTAPNYTIAEVTTGALTVTRAPLSVTAVNKAKTYDGRPFEDFTFTVGGFVNGDDLSVVSGASGFDGPAVEAVDAGAFKIVPTKGTLAAKNYVFTSYKTGTLTIRKAELTITANNATRTYGKPNPKFTWTLRGFVDGDTAAGTTRGKADCVSEATPESNAGQYTITCTKGTVTSSNYNFSDFVKGTLKVEKARLTVTSDSASKKSDGKAFTNFTVTISGFVNGDDASAVSGRATFAGTAPTATKAGTYSITPGIGSLSAENYSFTTFKKGTLVITAR